MTLGNIFCENIKEPDWNGLSDFSLIEAVDLWRISIKNHLNLLGPLTLFLSEEELLRVDKYHQQKDKIRFTLGKGMLRVILSRYLGFSPNDIQFKKGFNNKPMVDYSGNLQFNVSYSKNWIIIAISSEAVGVDIEYINENFDYSLVMESCFMKEEIVTIGSAPKPQNMFFQSWTRKEALLKATSWGLDDYLKDFSCLDGFHTLPKKFGRIGGWKINSFLMDKDYQVSLALNHQQSIRYCNNSISPFFNRTGG